MDRAVPSGGGGGAGGTVAPPPPPCSNNADTRDKRGALDNFPLPRERPHQALAGASLALAIEPSLAILRSCALRHVLAHAHDATRQITSAPQILAVRYGPDDLKILSCSCMYVYIHVVTLFR